MLKFVIVLLTILATTVQAIYRVGIVQGRVKKLVPAPGCEKVLPHLTGA